MEKEKNRYNEVLKNNENILAESEKVVNQENLQKKDLERTESTTSLEKEKEPKYDKSNQKKNNDFLPKFRKAGKSFERRPNRLQTEKLGMWRRWRGTSGGRRPTANCLILAKDEEKKSISFAYASGKEQIIAFRKCLRQAQKKLINYFPTSSRTIPHDITVSYKSTTIFLKPTPPGSGIKAGGSLNKLFKFLEIKDVSAKIIGSRRNKLNVIRTAMMALDKLTGKKYDY